MPTYNSTRVAASVPARGGLDVTSDTGEVLLSVALVTADDVRLVKVPAGARILDVILSSSGSIGGTANLTVGDASNNARFISSTAFTAATVARLNVHAGHGHRYTDETTIAVYAASIATGTTGQTLRLTVKYTMQ